MEREQFSHILDGMFCKYESLIGMYCENNETLEQQSKLLMRRCIRMIKLAMYSQDCEQIVPIELYEREKELINRACNDILNEVKRNNNIKKFNQDAETL